MNTVYWSPSTDANIQDYLLARGPSSTGPWTPIATVVHNLAGASYNAAAGKFFYVDNAGVGTDWYRLNARDTSLQQSVDTIFQAGQGSSMPTRWTVVELLASIKRAAMMTASQVTFTDDDLLALADEELASDLIPLVLSVREDYWTYTQDYSTASGAVRIPYRAAGGKVRAASILDAQGNELPLTRIQPEEAARRFWAPAFYVAGNSLVFANRTGTTYPTMRVSFYLRPSKLTGIANVCRVVAVDAATNTVQVNNLPDTFDASQLYDVMRSDPGFETIGFDLPATLTGNAITFATMPTGIAVGDHVTLAGESAIPQLPAELHPVLATLVAARVLNATGDYEGEGTLRSKLSGMRKAALSVISNRADANPEPIVPMQSPWRL